MVGAVRLDAGPLLGREPEIELLTSLLDGIGSSGGALVLRGEPGIGKSRLLAEVMALARERGIGVLSTTGVQSETHLPFSGLHQLLRGVRARRSRRVRRTGLRAWGDRARRELRASGESSRRRVPEARDRLTAEELQIAQLAAEGLTNREIGQRLYLSHRTVGTHLYRTFLRLGITARSELRAALSWDAA